MRDGLQVSDVGRGTGGLRFLGWCNPGGGTARGTNDLTSTAEPTELSQRPTPENRDSCSRRVSERKAS